MKPKFIQKSTPVNKQRFLKTRNRIELATKQDRFSEILVKHMFENMTIKQSQKIGFNEWFKRNEININHINRQLKTNGKQVLGKESLKKLFEYSEKHQ